MKMKFSSSGEGRENRFEAGGIFRWGRRRRHLTHLMHKEEGERLMKVPFGKLQKGKGRVGRDFFSFSRRRKVFGEMECIFVRSSRGVDAKPSDEKGRKILLHMRQPCFHKLKKN